MARANCSLWILANASFAVAANVSFGPQFRYQAAEGPRDLDLIVSRSRRGALLDALQTARDPAVGARRKGVDRYAVGAGTTVVLLHALLGESKVSLGEGKARGRGECRCFVGCGHLRLLWNMRVFRDAVIAYLPALGTWPAPVSGFA